MKEQSQEGRALRLIDHTVQDLRYAIRGLRNSPGFALLVVLVIAVGIAVNTAVFSVVNGVLLRPLSYRQADRIVRLMTTWKDGGKARLTALPDFQDWQRESSAFSAMAGYRSSDEPVTAGSSAEHVRVARISPDFLSVFSVEPVLGHGFSADEQAALISYSYWQTHFGGADTVLQQSVRVSGDVLRIAGVLPPNFHFPENSDIWRPLLATDQRLPRTSFAFLAIARLKTTVSLEQAQVQLASIAARLEREHPESNKQRSVLAIRMKDEMVGDVRITLYLLFGTVCLVLLIACANVATILLGKSVARRREMAIRLAVGAPQARIVRQLLTEGLLLGILGGGIGLTAALLGIKALVALAPDDLPRIHEVTIDGRVLAFTFLVSVACSVLFALAPALNTFRIDLNSALKHSGARNTASGQSKRFRAGLVIGQIAISAMLLVGAGLLLKSFIALNNVTLGFRPERVLLAKTSLPIAGQQAGDIQAQQFFRQLLANISSIPTVVAAGATMGPPGDVEAAGAYWTEVARENGRHGQNDQAVYSVVTPGTFAALGISLERGRDFDRRDVKDARPVAIVNEMLARKAFGRRDPIGKRISCGLDSPQPMEIVGVVADVRQWGPARKPEPEIYMPYDQHTSAAGATLTVVVRTVSDPEMITNSLRQTVHQLSADVPVKVTTMRASLYEDVATPRFRTILVGIFAAFSLGLAMAGLYGVVAYMVRQRTNELGVRIALGARPGQILRLVLKQGILLSTVGAIVGFAASLVGTRLMTSMLFEVNPSDPITYICVFGLLGIIVICASYFPARQAARLDPVMTLRRD